MNDLEKILNHGPEYWFLKGLKQTEELLIIHVVGCVAGFGTSSSEVLIYFDNVAAFHSVVENYSLPDDKEIHLTQRVKPGYFFQIATNSSFLDFVKKDYEGIEDMGGEMTLYRICTEQYILEVVSFNEPEYKIFNAPKIEFFVS